MGPLLAELQNYTVFVAGIPTGAKQSDAAVAFIELLKKMDPKTGQVKEENPQFLKAGDAAIVKIQPTKPLVIEKAKDFPQLGRFAIRDMGQTVAAGMCIDVERRDMT